MEDEYKSISKQSTGRFKDRGSKFIGIAVPVVSDDEIRGILENIRKQYHDARHHCYAYKLGTTDDNWRVNDDGEPSGTAGNPILGQIRSFGLTNILIIVVRYFGGTLLGTGGLINAYRSAAKEALQNAEIIKKTIDCRYNLHFPYTSMNDVMRIVKEENMEQTDQVFEMDCSMKIRFRASLEKKIKTRLELIDKLKFEKILN
ncbi:MAG TPA: YigZ family protein [Bacteroidales bacterium]|nr:YigZ family protein [Bacteroidales bacterium]